MVGVGENYFAPFALALGMGQAVSGLVTTVPLFLGATLQLVTPWALARLGSYRRWVVLCASLQALCFLPLGIGALRGQLPVVMLFGTLAVYWGAGLATVPAWNTWVEGLVPSRVRAYFFATRTRACQAALLVGFLLAGCTLQLAQQYHTAMLAFAALFMVALAFRLSSVACLASQREHPTTVPRPLTFQQIFSRFRKSTEGRLLVYLIAIQASVQVSGPYFTPFMLKQLKLPYSAYALLIGTSFLAKIVALSFWGKVAHRYGARRLMWFGGIGVIPISSLWLVSQSYPYLLVVQTLSGVCWAAYELAMFLLLFDSIRSDERVSILTGYNLANSTATCVGSIFGGTMLALLGQNHAAYLAVFGISSACRLLTLLLLVRVPQRRESPAAPQLASERSAHSPTARRAIQRVDAPHRPRPMHQRSKQTGPTATAV